MKIEQPQQQSENPSDNIEQISPELKKREDELARLRGRVDEIKDKLGLGIDEGIKKGVVAFNAFGLRTSQSCEGHFGTEEGGSPTPWIEVAPQEPEIENWYENDELREKVTKERNELQAKSIKLLDDFYRERNPSYDTRLGFVGIGYRFRIQSIGTEIFEELTQGLSEEEKAKKAKEYKQEMNDFVSFMKEKYLSD